MPEANETAVINVCGGCGYPTLGTQVCAYCLAETQPVTAQPAA